MHVVVTRTLQGLAWLVVAGVVVQFYLAGTALFGATTFQPHRALGEALAVAMLLLLVLALVARPGRRTVGLAAVLVVLGIVQVALPSLRATMPWVAALHTINAVALAMVSVRIARAEDPTAAARHTTEKLLAARSGT
jgi:Family of unknown function (DUF6220)